MLKHRGFLPLCGFCSIWLVILLLASFVSHATPLVLTEEHGQFDSPARAVLYDATGELSLADVKAKEAEFRQVQNDLGFGYATGAYWLKLAVQPDNAGLWWWVFDYPSLDQATLYVENSAGLHQALAGDLVELDKRAFLHRNLVFPLQLPAHEPSVLWLRVQSEGSIALNHQLLNNIEFIQHTRYAYLLPALYFGLLIALASYNFLLYLGLRERVFLWYVIFVMGFGLGALALNGLGSVFIWSGALAFGNSMLPIGFATAVLAATLFTRDFLNTKRSLPSWDYWLKLLILLESVALLGIMLVSVRLALMIMSAVTIMMVFVLTPCTIHGVLKKAPGALLFAIAWAMLLVGSIVMSLRNFGVLPSNIFTMNALQLGSALEMILISLGLAERFNRFKQQHSQMQQQMLEHEKNRVIELQQHETELAQKVHSRTLELERANQRLQLLAATDALTGLANRAALYQHFAQLQAKAHLNNYKLTVFFIDLDGFKPVNDQFGHLAGDDVLQEVAKRLQQCCRPLDLAVRVGGDEFLLIFEDIRSDKQAAELQQRIQQKLNQPYHYKDTLLNVTASLGMLRVDASLELESVLENADQAMYQEKQRKKVEQIENGVGTLVM